MKSKRIIASFNKVSVPIDRKEAMLNGILEKVDAAYASLEKEQEMNQETSKHTINRKNVNRSPNGANRRRKSMNRRSLVILIAAIVLMLTACTALAVYLSTVSKLKEDAHSQAARTEEELRVDAQKWAEAYAGGNIPTIRIDSHADIADVMLGVKTIELRPMNDNALEALLVFSFESQSTGAITSFDMLDDDIQARGVLEAFDSYCEIGIDARNFTLTVDGETYSPYVQPDDQGALQPAAGFNSDGTYSISFRDLAHTVSFGANMSLSGTLYRCDGKGERLESIGDFDIPFVYDLTQEERQAWLDSLVDGSIENQQAAADARLESLERLPESATPINATIEEITFLDIAATDQGFLMGLRYDLQRESLWGAQYLTYYVNGYKVDSITIDTKWDMEESTTSQTQVREAPCQATLLEQISYPAANGSRPEIATIACMREAGTGTNSDDPTQKYAFPAVQFVLRYNISSGEVMLPKDAAEKAAWLTDATAGNGQSEECRIYDLADQTQQVNGVKVSILRIAALSTGKWMVCYKIEDVACEIMAWETVPTFMVDGQQATTISKPQKLSEEKIAELLDNYSMKKNRWTTDEWEIQPPLRIELLPESFTVDLSWDLYDLTKSGERELIGTFNFQMPVNRNDCTITVDKAYLVGLDF